MYAPHDSKFLLIAPVVADVTEYRLKIESCKLYMKTLTLLDTLNLQLETKLALEPARYNVMKSTLKNQYIPPGVYDYNTTIQHDAIPSRLILGFIENERFNSSRTTSPFPFQNFDIQQIEVQFSGKTFPNVLYQIDWNHGYSRPYYEMQEALGFANTTESNGITMEAYKDRLCFFVFNQTSNQLIEPCFDLIKSGVVTVHIKFRTKTPLSGVHMLSYSQIPSLLMINKWRQVISDITI